MTLINARERHFVADVKRGERWRFCAAGSWWDAFVPAGPAGYRNFLADVVGIKPEHPGSPWFCLVGEVVSGGVVQQRVSIGSESQHTFTCSGRLEVFANDLPNMRWNNWGAVHLKAAPASGIPVAPIVTGNIADRWRALREFLEKTQGFLLVALLALGAPLILVLTSQGQDLTRSFADDSLSFRGARGPQIAFGATLLFLSLQAWGWTRAIVTSNYGTDRRSWPTGPYYWVLLLAPRFVGLGPFMLAAASLLVTPIPNWWLLGILLMLAAAFVFFLESRPKGRTTWFGRMWMASGFLTAPATMIWALVSPTTLGWWLGPPGVVFLGVGVIIPVLVTAVQSGAGLRLPLASSILIWAVLISYVNDNHGVRTLQVKKFSDSGLQELPRLTLAEAYNEWKVHQTPIDGSTTMVLVAAEGGASRAGNWTGEVLAALHDASEGRLAKNLFAISSVSGGSVGAAGYITALDESKRPKGEPVSKPLLRLTGADALSPLLVGLLFPDLLQRVIPFPVLPDRASALEQAWEQSWCGEDRVCSDKRPLEQPFLTLGPSPDAWQPLLIIEGASEETGRRILTSKLRLSSFLDADDFHDMVGSDVRISTAIHNGARFPWISPAGTLIDGQAGLKGHIVDGGYFDPAGLEVLRQLAHELTIGPARGDPIRFLFVFVGYEHALTPDKARYGLSDALAPLYGLYNSRAGHGHHLLELFRSATSGSPTMETCGKGPLVWFENDCKKQVEYLNVKLFDDECIQGKPVAPPLDWVLSERVRIFMHKATGMTESICAPAETQAAANKAVIRHVACSIGAAAACN